MKKSRIAMALVLLVGTLAVDGSLDARQDNQEIDPLAVSAEPILLKDLNVTPHSSEVRILQSVGSTTYFQVATGTFGRELWKTDGTAGGTVRVKVITSSESRSFGRDVGSGTPCTSGSPVSSGALVQLRKIQHRRASRSPERDLLRLRP